jgi:O-antigen/teichoic acid export membrane protein
MAAPATTASQKILSNSFWFGLESFLETFVLLGTTVAVARYLGPEKLGHYTYINFFVALITSTSGTGLAGATRKYMSEYLGLNRPGTARAVYHLAYRYQLLGSVILTALGLIAIYFFGEPGYKLMSSLLVLAIVPGVMSWVPAQANSAFEDARNNTLSAIGYIVAYAAVILLTLHFRWDLVGIAAALLVGRTVEVVMRTIPLHRKLRTLPEESLDPTLARSVRRFCFEAMGVQLLMSIVWGRSEMFFLRHFSSFEQIGFYSLSVGFANNLLTIPAVFANATGMTLMVESARDPTRVATIVRNASRYLLLLAIPINFGAVAIAARALHVVYGPRYDPAVWVLIVAALLAIPRAFNGIPDLLMRAADRQKQLFVLMTAIGIFNMALDYVLIRRYNAVGAAWGNGLAQSLGVLVIWQAARRHYTFKLPIGSAIRLTAAGLIMALWAFATVRLIPGATGLIAAILTAAAVYIVLVRLLHALEPTDRARLAQVGARFFPPLRSAWLATVAFVTPNAEQQ